MTKPNAHIDECLPKAYKLCSLKKIEELYKTGALIKAYPLRVMYLTEAIDPAAEPTEAFQVLFSAPKRRFKRAHDRNYIKRLMREVLRKNKMPLIAALHENNKKMVFYERRLIVLIKFK